MAAVYLGGGTVAESVPGLSAAFTTVGSALQDLRDVCDIQIARVADIAAGLATQASAVADAKVAIRIPSVADFQIQLDAAVAVTAGFTAQLSNPAAYLQTLLNGLISVQTSLSLQVPTVALTAQIAAAASSTTLFTAKIAAVDLELAVLTAIAAALAELAQIALAVTAAIRAAIAAALTALGVYLDMAERLLADGVHAFLYDGPLSGLGAAVDAITPAAGIGASVPVRVPIVVVDAANTSGLQGVNSVFRVN